MNDIMDNLTDTELLNPKCTFDEIHDENIRQLAKWGVQTHNIEWWLAILMEEVGEFSKAILEHRFGDGGVDAIHDEALQVATLSVKIVDMLNATR